jgi:hypothetical protein
VAVRGKNRQFPTAYKLKAIKRVQRGEGVLNRESGRRQGWGLKQVLLRMNGDSGDPKAVRAEFADAAQAVLQQRIRNLPSNRVFEAGWLRRIATYRRPIADPDSSPERGLRKSLRVTAGR